jgi:hypothetical protein
MTADTQRAFIINIRSLLLKVIDLIDREYKLGKYARSEPVTIGENDSIAGAVHTYVNDTTRASNDLDLSV